MDLRFTLYALFLDHAHTTSDAATALPRHGRERRCVTGGILSNLARNHEVWLLSFVEPGTNSQTLAPELTAACHKIATFPGAPAFHGGSAAPADHVGIAGYGLAIVVAGPGKLA